jgi:hypothetical protein
MTIPFKINLPMKGDTIELPAEGMDGEYILVYEVLSSNEAGIIVCKCTGIRKCNENEATTG